MRFICLSIRLLFIIVLVEIIPVLQNSYNVNTNLMSHITKLIHMFIQKLSLVLGHRFKATSTFNLKSFTLQNWTWLLALLNH